MVEYQDETVFPAPRDALWKLLRAHLDDGAIPSIHPLVQSQTTLSRSGEVTVVDRSIDVRGKLYKSQWKVTYRPPDFGRWEVVESTGPWGKGSFVENTYSDAPGGTLIRTRGSLTISVLPFFMSQKRNIAKIFDKIHEEDIAFVRR